MTNTVKRHSPPGAKRCAFTGYSPQKMPFGFNESDPRCIDFNQAPRQGNHSGTLRHGLSPLLVDNADLLLAAYDGQPGGTAMTCELARRYDVPVMKIKPTVN